MKTQCLFNLIHSLKQVFVKKKSFIFFFFVKLVILHVKSETHLFLSSHFFSQLWQLVRNWFGVYSANPSNIMDHFYHLGTSSGYGKSRCSLMHLIWFACSWVLWKERNDRLFQNKENSSTQILENIKLLSFWWFKAASVNFYYRFHNWCQNPFLYAGID